MTYPPGPPERVDSDDDDWMGAALAALEALPVVQYGHSCRTGQAIAALPPLVAEGYARVEKGRSSSDLAEFLNKWAPGFEVSGGQVARHRRRGTVNGCKCRPGEGPA